MLEVMKKVDYLQKDGQVAYGNTRYNYLSEEKITSELRKAFVEVGLVVYPVKMEILGEREVDTKNGRAIVTNILATYRIQDAESGEYVEVQALGEGMDNGDKNVNKAMTGAFKYMQRQSFMIPTGDDPDHTSSEELLNGKQNNVPVIPKPSMNAAEYAGPDIKFEADFGNGIIDLDHCAGCGKDLTEAQKTYCQRYKDIFQGLNYCKDCQDEIKRQTKKKPA
jgi:hypothetical protein